MDLLKDRIMERQADALDELHSYFHAPAATLHVLKAVFRLLKTDVADTHAWHKVLNLLDESFFKALKEYDLSSECDNATWKTIRCAYKGAGDSTVAEKRWTYELPVSRLGSVLMLFVRQVLEPN